MKSFIEINMGYRVDSHCLPANRVSGRGGAGAHYPWLENRALYSTPGVHYRVWEPAVGVWPDCLRFLGAGGQEGCDGPHGRYKKYESKREKLISAMYVYCR